MYYARIEQTATLLPTGQVLVVGGLSGACCPGSATTGAELGVPAAHPLVTFTPRSIGFGSQPLGTLSLTQTVALTNSGYLPLTVSSIALTGTNAGSVVQTNTCTATPILPGAGCAITLAFASTTPGTNRPS